jgi:transposase
MDISRSPRVFQCGKCGLVVDRDLNVAKNLAVLAELACVAAIMVEWCKS